MTNGQNEVSQASGVTGTTNGTLGSQNTGSSGTNNGSSGIANQLTHLNISETIPSSRFNGESGLDVHAFIQEVEGRVSSMGIAQGEAFNANCLNLAKARMDLSGTVLPALMASFNGAPVSQRTWPHLKQHLILAFSTAETQADLLLVELTLQRPPSFSETDIRVFIYKLLSQINRWALATDSDFPRMQQECIDEATYSHTTKSLVILILNASLPNKELRRQVTPKLRTQPIAKFPSIITAAMKNTDTLTPTIVAAATHTSTPGKPSHTTNQQNKSTNSIVRPYTNQSNRQTQNRYTNNKQKPYNNNTTTDRVITKTPTSQTTCMPLKTDFKTSCTETNKQTTRHIIQTHRVTHQQTQTSSLTETNALNVSTMDTVPGIATAKLSAHTMVYLATVSLNARTSPTSP